MLMLSGQWWKRLCHRELLTGSSPVWLCWNARGVVICLGSEDSSEDILRFYLKNKYFLLLESCVKVQDSLAYSKLHDSWFGFILHALTLGFSLIWKSCLLFYKAKNHQNGKKCSWQLQRKWKCDSTAKVEVEGEKTQLKVNFKTQPKWSRFIGF